MQKTNLITDNLTNHVFSEVAWFWKLTFWKLFKKIVKWKGFFILRFCSELIKEIEKVNKHFY